jgi:heat shock protein HslJ
MMDTKRIVLAGAVLALAALLAACGTPKTDQPRAGGAALSGTEWVLTSLSGNVPIEGTQITLRFGDGSLEGSAGCNTYQGSYTATEDSLRLSDLYWTEMGCLEPEGILDQEMAYLTALNTVAGYQVADGRLALYDGTDTQILVYGPRETGQSRPTETTPGKTGSAAPQDSPLRVTIEASESLPSGEVVNVGFELTNISGEGLFVLKWFTPLEGLAGDIFSVQRDGEMLSYQGKLVKRGPPISEEYVWIDAGGSISAEVDLAEGYDFSQAGPYTLQFRSPQLSHMAKTPGEQAASLDDLEMIPILSNPISVTIVGEVRPVRPKLGQSA